MAGLVGRGVLGRIAGAVVESLTLVRGGRFLAAAELAGRKWRWLAAVQGLCVFVGVLAAGREVGGCMAGCECPMSDGRFRMAVPILSARGCCGRDGSSR